MPRDKNTKVLAHNQGSHIYIKEKRGIRKLYIGSDIVQSEMRISQPFTLQLSYSRAVFSFLLFMPKPKHSLIIGLGGGSLPKFFYQNLNETETVVAEINEEIIAIARNYFFVPKDSERFRIVKADGANYIKQYTASLDVLIADGFSSNTHVASLHTPEFYKDCATALAEGGVFVANLWNQKGFNTYFQRIKRAFAGGVVCVPSINRANIILLAFKSISGPHRWSDLQKKARILKKEHGLELDKFIRGMREMNNCDNYYLHVGDR